MKTQDMNRWWRDKNQLFFNVHLPFFFFSILFRPARSLVFEKVKIKQERRNQDIILTDN